MSKSGGTTLCGLAKLAGRKNPHFDLSGNCLVEGLGGEPKWARMPQK